MFHSSGCDTILSRKVTNVTHFGLFSHPLSFNLPLRWVLDLFPLGKDEEGAGAEGRGGGALAVNDLARRWTRYGR